MDEIEVFSMCRAWLRELALAELPPRHLGDGSLWQPLAAPTGGSSPVLHASDALAAGVLTVTECRPAQVRTLALHSTSQCAIYVPHGLALKGGAQNRIVDVPVWLEPFGRALVEVSCVERRRWDTQGLARFERTEEVPWTLRSRKLSRLHRARSRGARRADDQQRTWEDVAGALSSHRVRSPTEDLLSLAPPPEVTDDVLGDGQGFAVCDTRARVLAVEVVGCATLRRVLLRRALGSLQRERGMLRSTLRTPSAWRQGLGEALEALAAPSTWSLRRGHGLLTVDVTARGGRLAGTVVATGERVVQLTAWAVQ